MNPSRFKMMFLALIVFCAVLAWGIPAWSAEQARIAVYVSGVEGDMADNVRAHLSLVRNATRSEFSEAWIKRMHGRAEEEIRTALKPFGYYAPTIVAELLPPRDAATPWQAVYHIQAGEAVRLQTVNIQIHGEAAEDPAFQAWRREFPLQTGDVLREDVYEQAKDRLLRLAEERGYFESALTRHELRVHPAVRQAVLSLTLDSGPRYRFGTVTFKQAVFSDSLLQQFIPFHPGDPYLGAELLAFRNALTQSDYFSAIDLQSEPDATAQPPQVRLTVTPQLRRRDFYQGRLGYGTDTGIRTSVGAGIRYLNRWGHSFNAALGIRESRNKQVLNINYTLPRTGQRDDFWRLTLRYTGEDYSTEDAGFTPEELAVNTTRVEDSYLIVSKQHNRKLFGTSLEEHLFVGYVQEKQDIFNLLFASYSENDQQELRTRIFQYDIVALDANYQVLYPGFTWNHRSLREDATGGHNIQFTMQGSRKDWGSNLSFWQALLKTTYMHQVGARHQFILGTQIGYTDAKVTPELNMNVLPFALQFRTGGDLSVRGYEFNELNAADSFSYGKHLLVASIEYQYRFLPQWSSAVFLDVGNAFNEDDFSVPLNKGVGIGVRWHSPVGEIRLDFATALDKEGHPWRIHINVGPGF